MLRSTNPAVRASLVSATFLVLASCGSNGGGAEPDAGTGSSGGSSSSGSSGSSSGGTASSGSASSSGGTSSGGSSSGGSGSGSGSGDAGSSGSGEGGLPTEPACTAAAASCKTDNTGCNVGSYYLYDNQWNCNPAPGGITCGAESAFGCSNTDGTVAFTVTSNQPAGNTAVLTYPSMQDNFPTNPAPTLASFTSMVATFEEASPHVGDYEVAWDCWFNDQANELMIWVDNYNQTPGGNQVESNVSLGGRTYDVYMSGSQAKGYIAFVATSNFTSGTVDLLEIFNHAASKGYMPAAATSTVGQVSFGVEVCSTNGQNATWTFNDYSVTSN